MRIICLCVSLLCCSTIYTQSFFLEEFDLAPNQPTSFSGHPNWAIFLHSRDKEVQYQPYVSIADHGPNCEPPIWFQTGDTHDTTHLVQKYEDMVYSCRNHLMTNIKADGYGIINLMPNQLVDFSQGEAVVRWDVSTFNQSDQNRDWFTVAVTPLDDLNPLHAPDWAPDLEGRAKNTIRIETTWNNGGRSFLLQLSDDNHQAIELPVLNYEQLEDLITPSKVVRSTFELRISRNQLKLGMKLPENHSSGKEYHWWVDTRVDAEGQPIRLNWDKGAVLFGHYSYNPRKGGGRENTWHWDNIYINPAKPFSIIGTDHRYADESKSELKFDQAAPEDSKLLFAATDYLRLSDQIELSFDEGGSWLRASRVMGSETDLSDSWGTSYVSYRIDVPVGASSVTFRGNNSEQQQWMARDVYIVADEAISTGIQVLDDPTLVKIFPNPIEQHLNVQWLGKSSQQVTFSLFDIAGKKIDELYQGNAFQNEAFHFDMSSYPSGIYNLKLKMKEGIQVIPVVKMSRF